MRPGRGSGSPFLHVYDDADVRSVAGLGDGCAAVVASAIAREHSAREKRFYSVLRHPARAGDAFGEIGEAVCRSIDAGRVVDEALDEFGKHAVLRPSEIRPTSIEFVHADHERVHIGAVEVGGMRRPDTLDR